MPRAVRSCPRSDRTGPGILVDRVRRATADPLASQARMCRTTLSLNGRAVIVGRSKPTTWNVTDIMAARHAIDPAQFQLWHFRSRRSR